MLVVAFALLPLMPARRGTAQAPTATYTIVDLGTLGGTESVAYGINNCAQVVGDASLSGSSPKHPFIWSDANSNSVSDPGEMQDLGTFAGGSGTASAINLSAYVAGDSVSVDSQAFRWHAPGPLQALGALPGDVISLAYDINDTSQVVGLSESASLTDRAFIWQNSVMTAVPTLNSITPMIARGINNSGKIVGIATNLHGFVHTGTTNIDIGTFGGSLSYAYEIGDDNRVVGYAETSSPNANVPRRAFIWRDDNPNNNFSDPGELKSLGTLGGTHSAAYDINSSAYVVGSADISSGADPRRAFIWHDANGDGDGDDLDDAGEMRNLNELLAPADPTWTLLEARSINDSGQIVGFGLKSGQIHAFLLTPTGGVPPSPCSLPRTIQFSSANYNVSESGVTATITVTRTGGIPAGDSVQFATSNGSATAGSDYTSTSGTLTFAQGETSKTFTVSIMNDGAFEPDETVNLTLSNPAGGATLGTQSTATLTITDDDAAPSFGISDVTLAEGNSGTTAFTFTVTKTGATQLPSSVNFATADETTTAGQDYTPTSGTLNFAASDTSMPITVLVNGDTTVEGSETFFVNLSGPTNATITDSQGQGTINNDDTDVTVTVSPSSVSEDGATNLVYTFTRNGVTSGPLTVNFSTTGSASAGDYTSSASGTVNFIAGNATATVTVDPTTDTSVEPDETVILTVTSGTGYNVANPSQATGTISNDDTDVSVAVSPSSVAEDGATNLVYTFTRTGVTSGALTVSFSVGGGATFNTDYTQAGAAGFNASSGSVTIAAGNPSAAVTIDPTTDTTVEPDETVILTVTSGSGYNVASPSAATGTITNDDTDVTVAVSPSSVTEDGATNLDYTFTRAGVTSGSLTVNFSVSGTATFSNDYTQTGAATFTPPSGTVTFAAGNATATITIDPTFDLTPEPDETVILTLTSGAGYNVASPSAATGTITNEDTVVSISVSPSSVLEDGATNLVFTLTRNGVTSGTLTVDLMVAGTAVFGTDYTQSGAATFSSSSGTVNFSAGSATATVTIDPIADSFMEQNEEVILFVITGPGYNVGSPGTITGTITNDDEPQVKLSAPSYSVNEGDLFATITVTRTGSVSAPATVRYATSDATDVNFACNPATAGQITGAASRKCDYHIAVGRLRFAAGETTKQIILSVVDDVYLEGTEVLTLTLSDPTGVNIGSPGTATINIIDNDNVNGTTNPIDGTSFYVRMLYVDLLSREPDPAGFAGWVHRIDFCGQPGEPPPPCDRVTVGGDGFLRSGEFFDRQFFVIRLYRAGLGRILTYNDVGDLAYVSGFLTASDLELNKQDLVTEIMSRPEFANTYNGLGDAAYVDKLIQTAAVTIPQSVRDGWVAALSAATKTRAVVYRELSERQEVSDRYLHEAQVVSCYYGFFTRNPDGAYFSYLDRLDRGEINLGDLANAFINASEYKQRFGP